MSSSSSGGSVDTCSDGVKDGLETDIDCGGLTNCPRCRGGLGCVLTSDCINNATCSQNKCDTCSDRTLDDGETDVDCGGSVCSPCQVGKACSKDSDCFTNNATCSQTTFTCQAKGGGGKGSVVGIVIAIIIILLIAGTCVYCCCFRKKDKIDDSVSPDTIAAFEQPMVVNVQEKHDFNKVHPGVTCRFCGDKGKHYSLYCPQRDATQSIPVETKYTQADGGEGGGELNTIDSSEE